MAEDVSVTEAIPVKRRRTDSPENYGSLNDEESPLNINDSNTESADQKNLYSGEPSADSSKCSHEENGDTNADSQADKPRVEDDDEDNISTISNLSDLMEESWRPSVGPMMWIQAQMMMGTKPREILNDIIPDTTGIPDDIDDLTLWKIIINIMGEPERRKKLKNVNTLDDAIHLLQTCKNIIVLTGAGVSVSCGIPDFRSRDGIYARLAVEFPDLPDPQAMFDIKYFKNDPRPFFKFAKEIYPGQFEPSKAHKFIKLLENNKKLLRNYTQNIDTLEQVAGIENVIQCHGSFAEATCMKCRRKVKADVIREDVFNQVIPHCTECPKDDQEAVMKPDIVFFGESLSDEFHKQMAEDKKNCDLLIVVGSSLKVRPVALIPHSLPGEVPQILINREPHPHNNFDVELLGDCDTIISEICKRLGNGWESLTDKSPPKNRIFKKQLRKKTPNDQTKECETLSAENNDEEKVSETDKSKSASFEEQETKTESQKIDNIKVKSSTDTEVVASEIKPNENKDCDDSGLKSQTRTGGSFCIETVECESAKEGTKDNGQNTVGSKDDPSSACESKSVENIDDGPNAGGSNDDLEQMRKMWQSKNKESLAKRLEDDQYLFLPPSQYVFHGAEVYSDDDYNENDFRLSSSSSSSSESDLEMEEDVEYYTSSSDDDDDESDKEPSENQSTEGTENLQKPSISLTANFEKNEFLSTSQKEHLSSPSEDNIPTDGNL